MPKAYDEEADESLESEPESLTAQEAAQLRQRIVKFSPWHVMGVQGLAGSLLVVLVWMWSGKHAWALSSAYGAISVLIPAMLFARGLARQQKAPGASAALAGMFVWELVKIILTVAMLFAAPRVVTDLNWLVLLAGFVVTLKASWLAMFWQHRRKALVTDSY